jgi:hypothetical protein
LDSFISSGAVVVGYIVALSWLHNGESSQWWHFLVAIPLEFFVVDLYLNGGGITILLLSRLFAPI